MARTHHKLLDMYVYLSSASVHSVNIFSESTGDRAGIRESVSNYGLGSLSKTAKAANDLKPSDDVESARIFEVAQRPYPENTELQRRSATDATKVDRDDSSAGFAGRPSDSNRMGG